VDVALPGTLAEFAVSWEPAQPLLPRPGALSITPSIAWTVAPQGLVAHSLLPLRITGGTRSEFLLNLPAGADRISLSGPELRNFTREGDQLRIYLRSAIRGDSELQLGFELPGAAAGEFALPEIAVPGARLVEGGWILVANEVGGELLELESKGLNPQGTREAPGRLQSLLGAGITYAYRRESRTPQARFDLVTTSPFPLVDTIADESELTCVLRPDGQELVRWKLRMRNNRRQFVRVRLPAGARLMHVKVEEELRRASVDGDVLLLPLVRSVQTLGGLIAFPIELIYVRQGAAFADSATRRLSLAVLIDAPIAHAKLDLLLPGERRLKRLTGAWREAQASTEFLTVGHGFRDKLSIDNTIGTTQPLSGELRFAEPEPMVDDYASEARGRNYWRDGYKAYKENRLEEAEGSFANALKVSKDFQVQADAKALLDNIKAGRGEVSGGRSTRAKASRIQKGLAGDNVRLASRQRGLIEKGLKHLEKGDELAAAVLLEDAQQLGEQLTTRGAGREQGQIEKDYASKLSRVGESARKNRELKVELDALKSKAQVYKDAKKVAHRVCVFVLVQATQDDFAGSPIRLCQRACERLEKGRAGSWRGRVLLLRRHLALGGTIVEVGPAATDFGIAQISGKRIQVQPAFGLGAGVAVDAMPVKEGCGILCKGKQGREEDDGDNLHGVDTLIHQARYVMSNGHLVALCHSVRCAGASPCLPEASLGTADHALAGLTVGIAQPEDRPVFVADRSALAAQPSRPKCCVGRTVDAAIRAV
jgi:hypothetical protein